MSADATPPHDTAARLLDAHVAWEVARLIDGGPDGTQDEAVAADVDLVLDLLGPLALGEVVEAATLSAAVVDVLGTVPPSPGATRAVTSFAAALAEHTPPARLHELISREHLEELTRRALGRADAIEAVLERLTDSPVTVRVAGGLVGRLVTEVLQANRAIAERIPGVGSLMSLGATAAGRVLGSAERPFEHLLSETAGRGATFAMRRLNRVLVDTLRDPDALAAVLEVYDLHADSVLPRPDGTPEEVDDLLQLVHDAVAAGLGSAPMGELVGVLVEGVLRDHGDRPVADVLDDLGLTRDELVVHAITLAPRALAAAHASGRLEQVVRARLQPFYASSGFSAALEA